MDIIFTPIAKAIVLGTVEDAFDGESNAEGNQALTEALILAKHQGKSRVESLKTIEALFMKYYSTSAKRANELADGLLIVCGVV